MLFDSELLEVLLDLVFGFLGNAPILGNVTGIDRRPTLAALAQKLLKGKPFTWNPMMNYPCLIPWHYLRRSILLGIRGTI